MKARTDKYDIAAFLKKQLGLWVLCFLLFFGLSWVALKKGTAYTREEQLNLAATVFAHKSEGREEALLQALAGDGIREVNLSFYDLADPSGMAGYLLTYGYHQADVFILDTSLGQPLLQDCFCSFSEEQQRELCEAAGFPLRFIEQNGQAVGLLIHSASDEAFNQRLSGLHSWLLFEAEELSYDFALFMNADSPHHEQAKLDFIKAILN